MAVGHQRDLLFKFDSFSAKDQVSLPDECFFFSIKILILRDYTLRTAPKFGRRGQHLDVIERRNFSLTSRTMLSSVHIVDGVEHFQAARSRGTEPTPHTARHPAPIEKKQQTASSNRVVRKIVWFVRRLETFLWSNSDQKAGATDIPS
jgi:hypothetical protein